MKFIVPIPDHRYYLWQTLVQIENFKEMGYEQNAHYPVIYFGNEPSEIAKKISTSKNVKCNFHFYKDERENKSYSASMKPWMMGKYFSDYPQEANNTYAYLDSDCIFTQPMDFTPFEQADNTWYGSDTAGYTGEKYIREKGDQLWLDLLNIAELNPELINGKKNWEIGAQYFIKNCPADLWFDIERKSIVGYKHMGDTAHIYKPPNHEYPIQKWCSEMYFTQYEAIRRGFELKVSPLMQFLWTNHNMLDWHKKPFFHCAGVPKNNGKDFCKIDYQSSPFKKDLSYVDIHSASYKYAELIKRTEKMFPDLVWE